MALTPVPMSTAELLELLNRITEQVLAGESLAGSIAYDAMEGPRCTACVNGIVAGTRNVCSVCAGFGALALPEGKEFWVHGVYRVGNTGGGQGGMRLIGSPGSSA